MATEQWWGWEGRSETCRPEPRQENRQTEVGGSGLLTLVPKGLFSLLQMPPPTPSWFLCFFLFICIILSVRVHWGTCIKSQPVPQKGLALLLRGCGEVSPAGGTEQASSSCCRLYKPPLLTTIKFGQCHLVGSAPAVPGAVPPALRAPTRFKRQGHQAYPERRTDRLCPACPHPAPPSVPSHPHCTGAPSQSAPDSPWASAISPNKSHRTPPSLLPVRQRGPEEALGGPFFGIKCTWRHGVLGQTPSPEHSLAASASWWDGPESRPAPV